MFTIAVAKRTPETADSSAVKNRGETNAVIIDSKKIVNQVKNAVFAVFFLSSEFLIFNTVILKNNADKTESKEENENSVFTNENSFFENVFVKRTEIKTVITAAAIIITAGKIRPTPKFPENISVIINITTVPVISRKTHNRYENTI